MKALVVFDSFFGNTEKIARAIGEGLGSADVEVIRVGDVKTDLATRVDLLIVGSPTRAFRPSPAIGKFLESIPQRGLEGVRIGAFDTRIPEGEVNFMVRMMMKLFGYAARPISDRLRAKGGVVAADPEGFMVSGKGGPLEEGELDRAREWAKRFAAGG